MGTRLRRQWPVLALAVAAAAILGTVFFLTDSPAEEKGNYSLIEDGLWLGGYVAQPPRGTRAVLNVCESEDTYRAEVQRWQPIHDAPPAPSIDWLRHQVEFIDEQRRAGLPVYVHCHAGISRGPMVVTAYMMARDGSSRDEVLAFLRTRRPVIRPNPAFMQLLLEWQETVKKPASR